MASDSQSQFSLVMRWDYSEVPYNDIRNFRIFVDSLCLYKFRTISTSQSAYVSSSFTRFNADTGRFESAGEIEWLRNQQECKVTFGIYEFHSSSLRRAKKRTSKSRRFKVRGTEYKWKKSEEGTQLTCTDTSRNLIAKWERVNSKMHITERGKGMEDELMVTCLLHQWWISTGRW